MIKNDKQLQITKNKLCDFENSFLELSKSDNSILNDIMLDALSSQIETFKKEIDEYEKLKNEKPNILTSSFDNIPETLVKARIVLGMSQKELADKSGLQEQQIQRYESTNYSGANFDRIKLIANSLQIQFDDARAIIKIKQLKVEGYEDSFITDATRKLHARKRLLTA